MGPTDKVTIVVSLMSNGSLTVPLPTNRHRSRPMTGPQPCSPIVGASKLNGSPIELVSRVSFDRALEMVSVVVKPQPECSV